MALLSNPSGPAQERQSSSTAATAAGTAAAAPFPQDRNGAPRTTNETPQLRRPVTHNEPEAPKRPRLDNSRAPFGNMLPLQEQRSAGLAGGNNSSSGAPAPAAPASPGAAVPVARTGVGGAAAAPMAPTGANGVAVGRAQLVAAFEGNLRNILRMPQEQRKPLLERLASGDMVTAEAAAYDCIAITVERLKLERAKPQPQVGQLENRIRAVMEAHGVGDMADAVIEAASVEPMDARYMQLLAEEGIQVPLGNMPIHDAKNGAAKEAARYSAFLKQAGADADQEWRVKTEEQIARFKKREEKLVRVLHLDAATGAVKDDVAELKRRRTRAAALKEDHDRKLFSLWTRFVAGQRAVAR